MNPTEFLKVTEVEELILYMAKIVEENRQLRKRLEERESVNLDKIMEYRIDILRLSKRTENTLWRQGITTIEKLCNKTYSEICKMRGMGETTMKDLTEAMEKYGLHFAEDDK